MHGVEGQVFYRGLAALLESWESMTPSLIWRCVYYKTDGQKYKRN